MSDDKVGWEGWFLAFVIGAGLPVGAIVGIPVIGGLVEPGARTALYHMTSPAIPQPGGERVTVGLAAAIGCVAVAVWLVRRTNWTSPDQLPDR